MPLPQIRTFRIYYLPAKVRWAWSAIALAMMAPAYLGQIWAWFFISLLSIPAAFTLWKDIYIDPSRKQIIISSSCLHISFKKEYVHAPLMVIRIDKVITSELNIKGMGSTHNYHYYNAYLEYTEKDDLTLRTVLSKWQLQEIHDLAKELQLEVREATVH